MDEPFMNVLVEALRDAIENGDSLFNALDRLSKEKELIYERMVNAQPYLIDLMAELDAVTQHQRMSFVKPGSDALYKAALHVATEAEKREGLSVYYIVSEKLMKDLLKAMEEYDHPPSPTVSKK